MATWLTSFRKAFIEAVLDLLWIHWTTLGVFGQAPRAEDRPIDPEALIIPTVSFGRFDPRLFDAFIEWWTINEDWLSSTRLQRFKSGLDMEEQRILSGVVESVLIQRSPRKWHGLVGPLDEDQWPKNGKPLFLMKDGRPLATVASVPDPIFRRFGFIRPKIEMRGVAEPVPMRHPGNLRLRLRGLFGVTSRAEITLFLLTHRSGHPRQIARHAHYSYNPVANALKQLAIAGYLLRHRRNREVEYELAREEWMKFLNLPRDTVWVDWARVFSALRGIWLCVQEVPDKRATEAILATEIQNCTRKANRFLKDSEIGFTFSSWEGTEYSLYPQVFEKQLRRLFRRLHVDLEAFAPAS